LGWNRTYAHFLFPLTIYSVRTQSDTSKVQIRTSIVVMRNVLHLDMDDSTPQLMCITKILFR